MKLDHSYILPSLMALMVHIVVAFIFMSEWQSQSKRTPPVQIKQRVEATLIDLDSLLAQQKQVVSAADKKAADKKAADKKKAAKKAADKKVADKKVADKKVADKKAADKKATDKKVADKKAADKKAANKKKAAKKAADKKVADKKVADKKAADKKAADKKAADKKAADKKAADKKAAEQKVAQELAEVEQALNDLLDDEDAQMQALEQEATNSQAVASAVNYIRNEIIQRWVRPANARTGMVVELVIHLVPTGEVVDIEIRYQDDSATDAFVASAVKAVRKVGRFDKLSQLKAGLFDANFREFNFLFKPEDLRL
ncbi:MAG: cell envelope integrity protein TolA [Oceanospirillaceae bacterium]|nr:cell envelope integrity protein TolA [Oceanospirillaceae bacterium]